MAALWLQNLAAHWLQAGLLATGAAAVAMLLRLRQPAIRVVLWQMLLALCLLLPLVQPWYAQQSRPAPATATMRLDAVAGQNAQGSSLVPEWPPLILMIVLAGVLLRLGWIALGLVRLQRLRRALPIGGGDDIPEVRAAIQETGVAASIRMAGRDGPLNFGMARPVIVLPASIQSLDSESRRAVILHELIHVRRKDWPAALVEEVLLAVLWFHPWAWWMRAQVRLAREEMVDREVVSRVGAREVYATCLLSMAGYDAAAFPPSVALLHPRELRHRIDALYQEVAMSRARIAVTTALLGSALVGLATAAVTAFPLTGVDGARDGGLTLQEASSRRIVQLAPPEYPPDALRDGISGTVVVEITVSAAGDVSGFKVVSGPVSLESSAVSALRQWRFEKAATADVLVAELGYQINIRNGRRLPGWSFVVGTKDTAAEAPAVVGIPGGIAGGISGGVPGGVPGGVAGGVAGAVSVAPRFTSAHTGGGTPAETPLRVGGNIKPPLKTKHVAPLYPDEAREAKIQGIVIIEATIGGDGRVTNTKILKSIPALDQAATDAVRQWEFQPVLLNGQPTPVIMVITMQFTL